MKALMLGAACAALVLLTSATAFGDYLSVCGYARFWDDRSDRDSISGSYLTWATWLTNQKMASLEVELWDEDGNCNDWLNDCNEADDDLLGVDVTDANGLYCFLGIGDAEDIYVRTKYQTAWGEVRSPAGSLRVAVSHPTRYDFGVNHHNPLYYRHFNTTCWHDSYNNSSGFCDNASDVATYFATENAYSNIAQSIADVDKRINLDINGNANRVTGYWPAKPGGGDCGGALSLSMDAFCLSSAFHDNAQAIAHEVGHSIHKRALDENAIGSGPNCDPHAWASSEVEKCATNEGFANFIAGVTYMSPSASGARFAQTYELEGLTDDGNGGSYEACVSIASTPESREGNVARFFWDLYDTTASGEASGGACYGSDPTGCETCSYGGFDNVNLSVDFIISKWSDFPSGTQNRQTREAGDNGRNAWDYWYRYPQACAVLRNNCLGGQTE